MKQKKDISAMYTKEQDIMRGRKCYHAWKREKVTAIPPRDYGMFLAGRGKYS